MTLLLATITGCSNLLPRGETVVKGPWQSYAEAQQTFDRIVPDHTRVSDLKVLGLDARTNPNITLLNYSDVLQRFLPSPSVSPEEQDGGVRTCLAARSGCIGYEVTQEVQNSQRYGNFWLDFLNFRRRTAVRGWRFSGMLLIVDDVVVYKLTGGQPMIHELEERSNPLGFLQGAGESGAGLLH